MLIKMPPVCVKILCYTYTLCTRKSIPNETNEGTSSKGLIKTRYVPYKCLINEFMKETPTGGGKEPGGLIKPCLIFQKKKNNNKETQRRKKFLLLRSYFFASCTFFHDN